MLNHTEYYCSCLFSYPNSRHVRYYDLQLDDYIHFCLISIMMTYSIGLINSAVHYGQDAYTTVCFSNISQISTFSDYPYTF